MPAGDAARELRSRFSMRGAASWIGRVFLARVLATACGPCVPNALALRQRVESGEVPGPYIMTPGGGTGPYNLTFVSFDVTASAQADEGGPGRGPDPNAR